MFHLPDSVFEITKHIPPGEFIFLVGGCVRDSLLQRISKDFDYVTTSDPRVIARRFADATGGAFYILDDERSTCRVLVNIKKKNQIVYDFAQLQGKTIEDDLGQRDFTINAMAVDLCNPDMIIDPSKGGRDLQKKILKPVTKTSLSDDPVRSIRAIRYAIAFGLQIDSKTGSFIEKAAECLNVISAERKRDELFKILEGEKIGTAIQLLHHFRIFENIGLKHNQELETKARHADVLSEIFDFISLNNGPEKKASFYSTSLHFRLGRYRKYLSPLFFDRNLPGRTHSSLVQMANLLSGADEKTKEFVKILSLSSEESESLQRIVLNRKDADEFLHNIQALNSRNIYHYFKKYGMTGIDLIILTLADYASRVGSDFSQDHWLKLLETADCLVQAWFERPEVVTPKPLLNGNDLISRFNLLPGERIGELLENLREEQASGNIPTRQHAENWIREQLSKKP